MGKIRHFAKGDFRTLHPIAIQTRSSVPERYLQDGPNKPKKSPSAYCKACAKGVIILSEQGSRENSNVLCVIDLNDELKRS